MLEEYLEHHLPAGAEGAVTRDPRGLYKFGRATEKQQWMLKVKPFVDAEAVVVAVEELMHNENEPETNQLGRTRRSSHKEGKVGGGKLGALRVVALSHWDQDLNHISDSAPRFRIGTGFTDADRKLLWAQRDELFGRIVKYKSMKVGAKDAPRHPVFLGFRAEDHS
jgi:DNA ligase-1